MRGENAPPPDGWRVHLPSDPRRPALIERHRDNCTFIDCRICTPPHVTRGEN